MVSKKGVQLSLNFLLTLLIMIILFVPACNFASKIIQVKMKTQDTFDQFHLLLSKLGEEGKDEQIETYVLYLGQKSLVANLWKDVNLNEFVRCWEEAEEHWMGVGSSCNGNDCICLVTDFKVEETDRTGTMCGSEKPVQNIYPEEHYCYEIADNYYVHGVDWKNWVNFKNPEKRYVVGMIKKGNVVYMCKDPPCKIPTTLEKHPTKSK